MASCGLQVVVQNGFIHLHVNRDKQSRSRSVPVGQLKGGIFGGREVEYANNLLNRASQLLSPVAGKLEPKLDDYKKGRNGPGSVHRGLSNASTIADRGDCSSGDDSTPCSTQPSATPCGFMSEYGQSYAGEYWQKNEGKPCDSPKRSPQRTRWADMTAWAELDDQQSMSAPGWQGGRAHKNQWKVDTDNQSSSESQQQQVSSEWPLSSDTGAVATTPITTVMLCHMPCRILHDDVAAALAAEGFEGQYDFIHVPTASRIASNLGYAFINFLDSATTARFTARFAGYRFQGTQSTKVCSVKPARLQGVEANSRPRRNIQQRQLTDAL